MTTLAGLILKTPAGGKQTLTTEGKTFVVYYDESPALGDNGKPVRGDVTGEFELWEQRDPDPVLVKRQHVSPHGTSGYGNGRAKPWAAEQIADAMMQRVRP